MCFWPQNAKRILTRAVGWFRRSFTKPMRSKRWKLWFMTPKLSNESGVKVVGSRGTNFMSVPRSCCEILPQSSATFATPNRIPPLTARSSTRLESWSKIRRQLGIVRIKIVMVMDKMTYRGRKLKIVLMKSWLSCFNRSIRTSKKEKSREPWLLFQELRTHLFCEVIKPILTLMIWPSKMTKSTRLTYKDSKLLRLLKDSASNLKRIKESSPWESNYADSN